MVILEAHCLYCSYQPFNLKKLVLPNLKCSLGHDACQTYQKFFFFIFYCPLNMTRIHHSFNFSDIPIKANSYFRFVKKF